MNLFTRVKKAIFKFEDYEKFIVEPISKAIKYFFQIVFIFSLIITIALAFKMNKETKRTLSIIENEIPNFSISNGILELEENEDFEKYFENIDLNIVMRKEENIDVNGMNLNSNSMIFLNNKIIFKYQGFSQELLYKDAFPEGITKENIINIRNTKEWIGIEISLCLIMLLICFIMYSIFIAIDILTLTILGMIINMIIKTAFRFKEILKISIYSLTLPMILYLIYIVSNILFGITIKYFEIAYDAISYIYLITVLLIMKADIIKNTQELQKILEEQKKVKEELEREKRRRREKRRKRKTAKKKIKSLKMTKKKNKKNTLKVNLKQKIKNYNRKADYYEG